MSLSIGLLMILTGLAIMAFGLFMSYAWLPLLCALIGFDVGLLLGRTFTGDTTAIVLGIVGAFILGAASYILEPYRRVLPGVSGGILFGLSVAAAFGLDGWFGGFFGRCWSAPRSEGCLCRDFSTYLLSVHLPSVVQPW